MELSAPARVIWMHGRDLRVTHCALETPGVVRAPATFEQVGAHGVAKVTLPRALGPGRATLHFAWDAPFADAAQAGSSDLGPGPTCGMPFPYGKLDHVAAGDYPGARENAGACSFDGRGVRGTAASEQIARTA